MFYNCSVFTGTAPRLRHTDYSSKVITPFKTQSQSTLDIDVVNITSREHKLFSLFTLLGSVAQYHAPNDRSVKLTLDGCCTYLHSKRVHCVERKCYTEIYWSRSTNAWKLRFSIIYNDHIIQIPANTIHWTNVGLMLVQRRRLWSNINP